LNRADERCSGHFNLDGLEQAFAHCFGDFDSCPHHGELSREHATSEARAEDFDGRYHHSIPPVSHPPVQVTVSAGAAKRFAAVA